jgi:hypothetical protein
MTRFACPPETLVLRFVDDDLLREEHERVEAHLLRCAVCREHEQTLRQCIADIQAPLLLDFDVQRHASAVMAALDVATTPEVNSHVPRPRARQVVFALMASAALLPLGYLAVHTRTSVPTWQARGGEVRGPNIARDVGVQLYANLGTPEPLLPGAEITAEVPLTAGYRNISTQAVSLLLFGLDARGVVHWVSPRFSDAREDPAATLLPTASSEQLLSTTVVFDDLAPGMLRVFTVLSATPMHVSDIEALASNANGFDPRDITRRLPQAEVRETALRVVLDRGTGEQ